VTRNRDLVLIRKLCGLGLPAQTLAPSLLPALRQVIPAHSAAVFWVDERFEMTGLYAERLLPPDQMARYYDKHYQQPVTGFPRAFGTRAAAADPVSVCKFTKREQHSDYFRAVLSRLDAYQILYGVLRGPGGPFGQLSIYRGERDPEFGRRDQDALRGLLRYLSIADIFFRYAAEDIELCGETIPRGSTVIVSLLAANRDPERFANPDTLDLHRTARGHLSFGHGIHQCLGQQLARIEMRAGFEGLLRRFPTLQLAVPAGEVRLRTDMNIYGVHELPVTWQ